MFDKYTPDEVLYQIISNESKFIVPFALADANDIRTALAIGDGAMPELPKGYRSNEKSCVLAMALSNGWQPNIDGSDATLYHPIDETKTEDDIIRSVTALKQMEFACAWGKARWDNFNNCWDRDIYGDEEATHWFIEISNTWAMTRLIELFDADELPFLDLAKSPIGV